MTLTAPTRGVPTLRAALRRAEKAGAQVEPIRATGEVRVIAAGENRLTINARRKDATRELIRLVDRLEAAQPQSRLPWQPDELLPAPAPRVRDNEGARRAADQIAAWIREHLKADPHGWRPYNSPEIAKAVGKTTTNVAVWTNYSEKTGRIELQRNGGPGTRIRRLRFADDVPTPVSPTTTTVPTNGVPAQAYSIPGGVGERATEPPLSLTATGILPTPKLLAYAEARKLAQAHQYLKAELSEAETAEILAEAVRLVWWIRAGEKS